VRETAPTRYDQRRECTIASKAVPGVARPG
jgi:hypothetical protein